VAFAQAPDGSPPDLQGVNALPVQGSPFSLEAAGVGESKRADGRVMTWASEGKVYRDSAGRTRKEWTPPAAGPEPQGTAVQIGITDPVAAFEYLLIVPERVAFRFAIPRTSPDGRPSGGFFFAGGSELIRETGEKTHKSEDLGKQTIQGLEFEGNRQTTTMVDEPSKFAVDEYWISHDMGLIGLVVRSSPKSKATTKIQNLVRKEPDPSLFVVPLDYRIEDIKIPVPAK
jgi:hypothetical protein